MNQFAFTRLSPLCCRIVIAAILLTGTVGCQKKPPPRTQQAAARAEVEQLKRELQLKKSSLSTVEQKIGDPSLTNLQPALVRLREKIRGEITELSSALEQHRGSLRRFQ